MYKILDIMKSFFEEPNRWFGVREFAKIIDVTPSTSSKYLDILHKKKILIRKKERNLILYKSNNENPEYLEIKKQHNLRKIRESGLMDYLIEKLNLPEAIILFGSYAKAENHKNSDIDLFILAESRARLELEEYEKRLKCRIQPFVYSRKEFESMKSKNKELLNNILNGIIIYGFIEVFR